MLISYNSCPTSSAITTASSPSAKRPDCLTLTHELVDVQHHLEGEISVKEIQSLDSSIKNVILWNEETGKTASILTAFSWERPYKINVIHGEPGPDSRKDQEERDVIAQNNNKWNVPTGVELASVLIDLFETFEKKSDDALLQFVHQKLGSQLKGDFPIDAHMSYLKKVRDHLGSDFIVTGVLHRNSEGMKLLLKTREGKEYILNVQTAPQESGKLGGLQLAAK